jgi:hypothetical protein
LSRRRLASSSLGGGLEPSSASVPRAAQRLESLAENTGWWAGRAASTEKRRAWPPEAGVGDDRGAEEEERRRGGRGRAAGEWRQGDWVRAAEWRDWLRESWAVPLLGGPAHSDCFLPQ